VDLPIMHQISLDLLCENGYNQNINFLLSNPLPSLPPPLLGRGLFAKKYAELRKAGKSPVLPTITKYFSPIPSFRPFSCCSACRHFALSGTLFLLEIWLLQYILSAAVVP
jgi:hypothetical protein